jgi:hypothetical protein
MTLLEHDKCVAINVLWQYYSLTNDVHWIYKPCVNINQMVVPIIY